MRNLERVDEVGKKDYLKLLGFGFILWIVPFLISFLFYSPQGVLLTSEGMFKSVMTVTGTLVAVVLILKYMNNFTINYLKEATTVAAVWFLMSVILDLLILVPFAKMDLVSYFSNIALGYISIPIICLFAGYLLEAKSEHNKKIFSQVFSTKKD
jgi:uncharacterized membrane protein YidH (DUF202 family)